MMLAYFMGIGGLAIGFIIGMLYSDFKNKKNKGRETNDTKRERTKGLE